MKTTRHSRKCDSEGAETHHVQSPNVSQKCQHMSISTRFFYACFKYAPASNASAPMFHQVEKLEYFETKLWKLTGKNTEWVHK